MKFPKLSKLGLIIPAYCQHSKQMFGIRTEQTADREWIQTWAYKLDLGQAEYEKITGNRVNGKIHFSDSYNGCPYCGSKSWFECSNCHSIVCYDGQSTAKCPKCNSEFSSFVDNSSWDIDGGAY